MATTCTRCEGSGFLNLHQIPEAYLSMIENADDPLSKIKEWICKANRRGEKHDVRVCDCCGDGEGGHGIAGVHYNGEEREGAYDYNRGICDCH
jgi:hypothetical protein